jgi:RNA polymerase sigma-70 factor (ECF subfamily)
VGVNELTLSEAYEKWADDLVGFATALIGPGDAADVVADAFVSLLEDGAGWSRAERPRSFLFGVVANRAKMRLRTSARRRGREQRAGGDGRTRHGADVGDGPGDARRLLGAVTIQQRTFLYLAYWEDWPVDEIAAHAEVTEGTVRKQLARARSKLREELT